MTRQELPVIWEKLNYLVGLCYPNWVDSPYAGVQVEGINPITMVSPICELTIGDMYNNTPGYLSGITMTVQDGTTWEFEENMKLPHYVQVAVEFVYIGKYLPNAKGKHFELNWLNDTNDKTGTHFTTNERSLVDRNQKYNKWIQRNSNVLYSDSSRKGIFKDNVGRFKKAIGLDN